MPHKLNQYFYLLYLWYSECVQCIFIQFSPLNFLLHTTHKYRIVFCIFTYFYHCFAIISACLLFACSSVNYLALAAFFRKYCSLFSFSCQIVINGRCFSCQIYNWRWRLQQLSTGSSGFFYFLLKSFLRYFFQQGKGFAQSSSDLFLEYMTDTFQPLTLKSGEDVCFRAKDASYGVKNQMKAKSFNWPVILFLIILISFTEQIDSKRSNNIYYSVSTITGPRTIKLQLFIFSSLLIFVGTTDCELQLNLQFAFFQLSQRQHLFLLAKFLQSHLSQYQSQAIFRSMRLNGQKFMRYYTPFMIIDYFSFYFTAVETYIDGYFAYMSPYLNQTQSGTLVPALILASVNALYAAYLLLQFQIFSVFVYQILQRGQVFWFYYYFSCLLLSEFRLSQLYLLLLEDEEEQCFLLFLGLRYLSLQRFLCFSLSRSLRRQGLLDRLLLLLLLDFLYLFIYNKSIKQYDQFKNREI